jgi:hypothetical protein
MSLFGSILSSTDLASEEAKPTVNGFDEATSQSTTSGTLEDIAGNSISVTTPVSGRILALLLVQCSTTGGAPATAAFAVSINSVDGNEMQRYLSGTSDTGGAAAASQSGILAAGTYTVQGRFRRVSGSSTVNADRAQLLALFVAE